MTAPRASAGAASADREMSATPALAVSALTAGYPRGTLPRREGRSVGGPRRGAHDTEPVLHELDLAVDPGTLLAVLGPSGCGKTTLLRVVAGLLPATSGRVKIAGTVVTDGPRGTPPEDRRIGLVPQDAALFPHLDVAANVEFGLHRRRSPRGLRGREDARSREERRDRVRTLLDLVGLTELARRRPHELSGGQRQRVALARALAPSPALVLLDEPFSALDAALRADLRAEVRLILRDLGATTVLVTHDQEEAMSVSDRIAVLRDGRLVQDDRPDVLYARPVDTWVARFVGDCVLLAGTSDGTSARCELGTFPTTSPPGPVTVVLRPEQLRLEPAGHPTAGTGTAAVDATVVGADYFGHDTVYRVRTRPSGSPLLVRAPAGRRFEDGSEVSVSTDGHALTFVEGTPGPRPAPTGLDQQHHTSRRSTS